MVRLPVLCICKPITSRSSIHIKTLQVKLKYMQRCIIERKKYLQSCHANKIIIYRLNVVKSRQADAYSPCQSLPRHCCHVQNQANYDTCSRKSKSRLGACQVDRGVNGSGSLSGLYGIKIVGDLDCLGAPKI